MTNMEKGCLRNIIVMKNKKYIDRLIHNFSREVAKKLGDKSTDITSYKEVLEDLMYNSIHRNLEFFIDGWADLVEERAAEQTWQE